MINAYEIPTCPLDISVDGKTFQIVVLDVIFLFNHVLIHFYIGKFVITCFDGKFMLNRKYKDYVYGRC